MQERLYLPKEDRVEYLSAELYLELHDDLVDYFVQNGTYKDESLLVGTDQATLDVVVRKVAAMFESETPLPTREAIAYEAFYFALKISYILPGCPPFVPNNYYAEANSELMQKMAKDFHNYTQQHEVISKLLDEHLCNIDQFGNDFVMAETFAAVALMQIEAELAKMYIATKFGEIIVNFANKSA